MRHGDPAREQLLSNIKLIFNLASRRTGPRTTQVEMLSRALSQHIARGRTVSDTAEVHKERVQLPVQRYLAIAAGVIIAVSYMWLGGLRTTTTLPIPAGRAKIYTTLPGQRAKIDIGDGSSVILAVNSRLKLAPDFGKTSRAVELEGQALFTVAHDGGVPFIVATNGINTRVLGTTFSVRRYPEEKATDVIVASGKVEIAGNVLLSGDRGRASSPGDVTVIHDTNVSTAFAWADGRLLFDRTPLRDAVPELERWYGVKIKVTDDGLLDRRITTILTNERVQDALQLCAEAVNARLSISGSNAVISKR